MLLSSGWGSRRQTCANRCRIYGPQATCFDPFDLANSLTQLDTAWHRRLAKCCESFLSQVIQVVHSEACCCTPNKETCRWVMTCARLNSSYSLWGTGLQILDCLDCLIQIKEWLYWTVLFESAVSATNASQKKLMFLSWNEIRNLIKFSANPVPGCHDTTSESQWWTQRQNAPAYATYG